MAHLARPDSLLAFHVEPMLLGFVPLYALGDGAGRAARSFRPAPLPPGRLRRVSVGALFRPLAWAGVAVAARVPAVAVRAVGSAVRFPHLDGGGAAAAVRGRTGPGRRVCPYGCGVGRDCIDGARGHRAGRRLARGGVAGARGAAAECRSCWWRWASCGARSRLPCWRTTAAGSRPSARATAMPRLLLFVRPRNTGLPRNDAPERRLARPAVAVCAAPGVPALASNAFPTSPWMAAGKAHYSGLVLPFVALGAAAGLARLRSVPHSVAVASALLVLAQRRGYLAPAPGRSPPTTPRPR